MEKKVKIGNVELKNNVFLAPMAGITDLPFRILCKEQGCGLVYTEMVSTKGIYFNDLKSASLAKIIKDEKPVAIQLFGSDPEIFKNIMPRLNESDADIIDINMGCPVPKVIKNGEGSALMKNPRLVGEIVKAAVANSNKPITVKIRKGWTRDFVNAVEIAKIIEENGARAVTIHGRTRDQYYSGIADWDIIAKVKKEVSIPVIGNGDIASINDAKKMIEITNCDAVMIGRGAMGNPWIFNRIQIYLNTGKVIDEPNDKEKLEMINRHMNMMVEYKGEKIAVFEMRKHIAWYLKGMKNASTIKNNVYKLTTKDDILNVLNEYSLIMPKGG